MCKIIVTREPAAESKRVCSKRGNNARIAFVSRSSGIEFFRRPPNCASRTPGDKLPVSLLDPLPVVELPNLSSRQGDQFFDVAIHPFLLCLQYLPGSGKFVPLSSRGLKAERVNATALLGFALIGAHLIRNLRFHSRFSRQTFRYQVGWQIFKMLALRLLFFEVRKLC